MTVSLPLILWLIFVFGRSLGTIAISWYRHEDEGEVMMILDEDGNDDDRGREEFGNIVDKRRSLRPVFKFGDEEPI